MRLNKYVARATGMSRRTADNVIAAGRVMLNGHIATTGQEVRDNDKVKLDNQALDFVEKSTTIMLNKPMGYICSRDGQGGQTIYNLLPTNLHRLKPVGRLDKNSSGLLLLTNDGQLAFELTHPKFHKTKKYTIATNKPVSPLHQRLICNDGIILPDGLSKLQLERINHTDNTNWKITMTEGRNRQIRRTFQALGYDVVKLHRTNFGQYRLGTLTSGKYVDAYN